MSKIGQSLTSMEVAQMVRKEHKGLLRDIRRYGEQLAESKIAPGDFFKDTKIRAAVYTDIYNQIKREFGLYDDKGRFTSYKALKRRYIYEAHELIDSYELPTYLAEQIKNSNAQLNVEVA